MASRNLNKIVVFSTDFVDFIIAASQILVAKGFAETYFTRPILKAWIQALSQISFFDQRGSLVTGVVRPLRFPWPYGFLNQLVITWNGSIAKFCQNVKLKSFFFPFRNALCFFMFITAVCFLLLLKWQRFFKLFQEKVYASMDQKAVWIR